MLTVKLDDIQKRGLTIGTTLGVEWLKPLLFEDVYQTRTPAKVELRISKRARYVLVEGRLSLDVAIACTRCLAQRERALRYDFEQKYYPLPEDRVGSTAPDDDSGAELDLFFYEGKVLDLEKGVREHLVFALDPHPTCRDNENCETLSLAEPASDDDAPIDPRWAALKDLKL